MTSAGTLVLAGDMSSYLKWHYDPRDWTWEAKVRARELLWAVNDSTTPRRRYERRDRWAANRIDALRMVASAAEDLVEFAK